MEGQTWTPEETQQWMCDQLKDINGDTDCILSMLHKDKEESKMGDHFDMGMLAGMLQNKGIDPSMLALLNNDKGGWGQDSLGFLILILLFVGGFGGNGFGFGGNNNASIAGVDTNMILNAIQGQGARQEMAINSIANTLGCSFGQVQSALASVDKQIAVNQGSIINSIQSCCCNVQSAIDQCCCKTNLNIERVGNGLSKELGGAIRDLSGQLAQQSIMINDKFCALELREKQNQIDALRDRVLDQKIASTEKYLGNLILNQKMVYSGTVDGTLFSGTGTIS